MMKYSKYKNNLYRNIKHKIKIEVAQLLTTDKASNGITHSNTKKLIRKYQI